MTAEQIEWPTDLAFRDAATLAELDPHLIHRAIETGGDDAQRGPGPEELSRRRTTPAARRPMRKGVAEMPRPAELSRAANDRCLEALGDPPSDTPLGRAAGKLCRPVVVEARRYRALNPLADEDARLLEAVSRGEGSSPASGIATSAESSTARRQTTRRVAARPRE